ncbi:MAG TPA: crosslink repair DNA glycosylase YcaQ family protein [Terriglobales bacterium]|jgi:hypothetical protein|nr:crosslink repair DNA glycosylase YcaQ family protein [Terriglobales bacterium]
MTDRELQEMRREKWRVAGNPARTLEALADFMESAGFCLMYPQKPMPLVPTFLGAFTGDDSRLPTWQNSFSDAGAREATELMVRLLRQRSAYEANLFGENNFLVAASVFPYFYASVGDRSPRRTPKAGVRSDYGSLARDAFEVIRTHGPVSRQKLLQELGGGVSAAALDHALGELWSKLRITRVDYDRRVGASWDALYRWSPEAVRQGINMSVGEGLSALISKYLDCVIAAEPQEVEDFFAHFVPRSKVKDALNALLSARELSFVHAGHRSLLQVSPAKSERAQERA